MRSPGDRVGVLIVGGGPTGLLLAAELVRRGVPARVVDRTTAPRPPGSRALAVSGRTLMLLDDLGLATEAVRRGHPLRQIEVHDTGGRTAGTVVRLPIDRMPSPFPFTLSLPQPQTEDLLRGHATRVGVPIETGVECVDVHQADDHVVARLRHADGSTQALRADWLVGCDGAHSQVRSTAGIATYGYDLPESFALGDVVTDWARDRAHVQVTFSPAGLVAAFPMPGDRHWRFVANLPDLPGVADNRVAGRLRDPDLASLQRLLDERLPDPPRLTEALWTSTFRTRQRRAATVRRGRVLLAGDAAHSHSPVGGQGMNTGLQDAYALGWRLALVVRGQADASLLDTYAAEREPVADRLLTGTARATRAVTAQHPAARQARGLALRLIAASPPLGRWAAGVFSQLGLGYPDSPLTESEPGHRGRRRGVPGPGALAPDVALATPDGPTLRQATRTPWFSLLLFAGSDRDAARRLRDDAARIRARFGDLVTARVVATTGTGTGGTVLDPTGLARVRYGAAVGEAVLVRPDGYLAHRSTGDHVGRLERYLRAHGITPVPAGAAAPATGAGRIS
ncbi:FAD-dependent monooxygenase [Frankia tisae]|uniref:FAD-dependent monooxygenase n=1 Tax=Frankia tisae TaxID=2950104 RepID=UPI0021BF935E|nr:FAD-dependent monooxygenase [Frankia tisae]